MSFFLQHFVSSRVAKYTYGTNCITHYDPNNSEHLQRRARILLRPSGTQALPDGFMMILAKVRRIHRYLSD